MHILGWLVVLEAGRESDEGEQLVALHSEQALFPLVAGKRADNGEVCAE
jgi:hypothetical protein